MKSPWIKAVIIGAALFFGLQWAMSDWMQSIQLRLVLIDILGVGR